MRIIQRPRQTGKTTDMVNKILFQKNTIMLVFSSKERKRIIEEFSLINGYVSETLKTLLEEKVMTMERFRNIELGRSKKDGPPKIYIDNLDMFLHEMFRGCKIEDCTITNE